MAFSQLIAHERVDVLDHFLPVLFLDLANVDVPLDFLRSHHFLNGFLQLLHSLPVFGEVRISVNLFKPIAFDEGLIVYPLIEHEHQDLFGPSCVFDEE